MGPAEFHAIRTEFFSRKNDDPSSIMPYGVKVLQVRGARGRNKSEVSGITISGMDSGAFSSPTVELYLDICGPIPGISPIDLLR